MSSTTGSLNCSTAAHVPYQWVCGLFNISWYPPPLGLWTLQHQLMSPHQWVYEIAVQNQLMSLTTESVDCSTSADVSTTGSVDCSTSTDILHHWIYGLFNINWCLPSVGLWTVQYQLMSSTTGSVDSSTSTDVLHHGSVDSSASADVSHQWVFELFNVNWCPLPLSARNADNDVRSFCPKSTDFNGCRSHSIKSAARQEIVLRDLLSTLVESAVLINLSLFIQLPNSLVVRVVSE